MFLLLFKVHIWWMICETGVCFFLSFSLFNIFTIFTVNISLKSILFPGDMYSRGAVATGAALTGPTPPGTAAGAKGVHDYAGYGGYGYQQVRVTYVWYDFIQTQIIGFIKYLIKM